MTKLGVDVDEVTQNHREVKAERIRPLRLNRMRQSDASWAPVDPQMSRQVPSHQMSAAGPPLQGIQGVKQLCTLCGRQAFVIK